MRARGLVTAHTALISGLLSTAVAGVSIGLAIPASAAPEGPDSVEATVVEEAGVVLVEQFGAGPLDRARALGVPTGLLPQRLAAGSTFVGVG